MSEIPEEILRLPFRERSEAIRAWSETPAGRGYEPPDIADQIDAAFASARLNPWLSAVIASVAGSGPLAEHQLVLDGPTFTEQMKKLFKWDDEEESE